MRQVDRLDRVFTVFAIRRKHVLYHQSDRNVTFVTDVEVETGLETVENPRDPNFPCEREVITQVTILDVWRQIADTRPA